MDRRGEHVVTGDTDWRLLRAERIAHDGIVLIRDQEQPNSLGMLRPTQFVVHEGYIEAELAEVLGSELCGLEFDDHVAELLDVEEQEIDEEVIAVDVEVDLPADERESIAELSECAS